MQPRLPRLLINMPQALCLPLMVTVRMPWWLIAYYWLTLSHS